MAPPTKLQLRLVNYHVGSRDFGIGFRILPRFSSDILNILFDADEDSVEHTKGLWESNSDCETRVFPYCLSNAQKKELLHINFDPYTSSVMPFNSEYKDFYSYYEPGAVDYVLGESIKTMELRTVEATTLDELLRRPEFQDAPPDFLSIDTQGSEYNILRGGANALRNHALGVLVEVEFVPIYENQPLMHDVQVLIEDAGFRFVGLTLHEEFSPFRAPVGARARGFQLSGDALFLRRWETIWQVAADDAQRYLMLQKLAFISVMFGRVEYALEVLYLCRTLEVSPQVKLELMKRIYPQFLQEMLEAVTALPVATPSTMAESMTFEQSQARFRPKTES